LIVCGSRCKKISDIGDETLFEYFPGQVFLVLGARDSVSLLLHICLKHVRHVFCGHVCVLISIFSLIVWGGVPPEVNR